MSEIVPLFSTPLYRSTIKDIDFAEIDPQIRLANFKEINENFWLSVDDGSINKVPNLKLKIINHINTYLFDKLEFQPFEFYFADSWFVRVGPGGSTPKHFHSNSLYSGVVYLRIPGEGGEIKFHSPETFNSNNTVKYLFKVKESNFYNCEGWAFTPSVGEIIIFPSHLSHEVIVNNSEFDRYSFSFNILPYNFKSDVIGNRVI